MHLCILIPDRARRRSWREKMAARGGKGRETYTIVNHASGCSAFNAIVFSGAGDDDVAAAV